MAIDNLNFYNTGLPAGQLTDRYSSQPGCLRSKNLDIFSSSKSVKATAWSQPTAFLENGNGILLRDQTGNLILKDDGAVYDISSGEEVLVKSGIVTNFPSYNKISYDGKFGTYADAQRGTPKQLISKYADGELKYFTIFTDKSRYSYSVSPYEVSVDDQEWTSTQWTRASSTSRRWFKSGNNATSYMYLRLPEIKGFTKAKISIKAANDQYSSEGKLIISSLTLVTGNYRYNAETDQIEWYSNLSETAITVTDQLDVTTSKTAKNEVPLQTDKGDYFLKVGLTVTNASSYTWSGGYIEVDVEGYNDYYHYLPDNANRHLEEIGEYYWERRTSFQLLYNWDSVWGNNDNRERVVIYDLVEYMGWASEVSMDVIGLISWNEQVYMIGNMDGNGYIFPCDLTGLRGTPFIAYGCEFKGVVNIDYLMYLVGEDRGVSQLWVYNGQELVSILGGTEEKNTINLIDNTEQYKFSGKMVNYRKDLVLSTTDNRIFAYGQTYGGKGGVFIHEVPGTITDLKVEDKDLIVKYSVTTTSGGVTTTTEYITALQDDKPIKYYNTEWMAEYPMLLGNHLLEKEESDLYASYILPSSSCKLEFWGMANHYHFWTFKTDGNTTPAVGSKWVIDGTDLNYYLEFVEKNSEYLTFKLVGDLPAMTASTNMRLTEYMTLQTPTYINYTEYNHFRKIGEITTTGYQEGEFRFHNLNNKLELPKSYSLQIMVKGKGTTSHTPELFALDLVANQRDRG